ncbi:MAG: hypothetical protein N3J91_01275 [Verrucomicrobiae bacterium]|nr:hypothetical protein [Verrucomicrobiae bacterium]
MKAIRKLTLAGGVAALAFPVFMLVLYLDSRLSTKSFGTLTLVFMVLYFLVCLLIRRFSKSGT